MEYQQPETTEEFEDHVQPKDPILKITPTLSPYEDNASKYRILVRKRSIRPRNKFRLKSKAVYDFH
jgi:hypothetical protein